MGIPGTSRRRLLVTGACVAAVVAAVTFVEPSRPKGSDPGPPVSAAVAEPAGEDGVLRQSRAEIKATVAGFRKVDDHPLYEMTYHGGYDREREVTADRLRRSTRDWACSLFVSHGAAPVYGRNFDWQRSPVLAVRSDPPDGYSSFSLVHLAVLFDDPAAALALDDAATRTRLAHAVLIPFDGMNEKGLAVGMAQVPEGGVPAPDPARPTVNSVRIIRIMLDQAASVDEAIALFRRYNVDFAGGPKIHYLVADATGKSAVLEFSDGELKVLPGTGTWQAATNFTQAETPPADWRADRRYGLAARRLERGPLDWKGAMNLLEQVSQHHTRWSVVYDLKGGTARVAMGKRYGTVHTFKLADLDP
ncbi:carcinine hydrolase/isopenicillin-N N-acyltransferase family protein [Rhizohabitans arisaemae]|uniref:carcinine hydrolase/isopenicillin-N N-acyltransferase family protein n=1 Tax=Rhizohabitans arisaemae TaxID=2720610 RepID=UPI0024B0B374|nr:carcinine hydrolase/isopenicillin-N N-acyltransferase family protein [Rhizohabitans arisaemae]